jgi:hypothetical protein
MATVYSVTNLETVMTVLGNENKRHHKVAEEATDNAKMTEALKLCVVLQDAARKVCDEFHVDYTEVYTDFFHTW